jgi:hypothetical protein
MQKYGEKMFENKQLDMRLYTKQRDSSSELLCIRVCNKLQFLYKMRNLLTDLETIRSSRIIHMAVFWVITP